MHVNFYSWTELGNDRWTVQLRSFSGNLVNLEFSVHFPKRYNEYPRPCCMGVLPSPFIWESVPEGNWRVVVGAMAFDINKIQQMCGIQTPARHFGPHWTQCKNITFTHPVHFGGRKERQKSIPWHCLHVNQEDSTKVMCTGKRLIRDQYLNFHSKHHLQHKKKL